ncbi:MAG: hypothetical protein COV59_01090 [Candidatus Magasanikbacteria bacterium CG11_big_fil_rev_8_21_14_0_20_39_34]|uniref:Uncharacterized protein n=1 Tax=Candidatus Magasanikbacteria bacterium CG11_big_fil_rev_8_21_14_0_20_39_34 TaxID=1974653 RepID=A0A2H0N8G7_9BACT|nr:MAG: hypothetical protein COV59_01090 [Candidatus Magasanikbacteria bacterium CG11_big_fil_rev_8_21_14_0_20_39_34]
MHQAYERLKIALNDARNVVDTAGFFDIAETDLEKAVERMDITDLRMTLEALKEKRKMVADARMALPERPPRFEAEVIEEAKKDPDSFFSAHQKALNAATNGEAIGRDDLNQALQGVLLDLSDATFFFEPEAQMNFLKEKKKEEERRKIISDIQSKSLERPFFPYTLAPLGRELDFISNEGLELILQNLPELGHILKKYEFVPDEILLEDTVPVAFIDTTPLNGLHHTKLRITLNNEYWKEELGKEIAASHQPTTERETNNNKIRFILWDTQFGKNLHARVYIQNGFVDDRRTPAFLADTTDTGFRNKLLQVQSWIEEYAREILEDSTLDMSITITQTWNAGGSGTLEIPIFKDEATIKLFIIDYVDDYKKLKLFNSVRNTFSEPERISTSSSDIPDTISENEMQKRIEEILNTLDRAGLSKVKVVNAGYSRIDLSDESIFVCFFDDDWREQLNACIEKYTRKLEDDRQEQEQKKERSAAILRVQRLVEEFNTRSDQIEIIIRDNYFTYLQTSEIIDHERDLPLIFRQLRTGDYPRIQKIVFLPGLMPSYKDEHGTTFLNIKGCTFQDVQRELDFFGHVSFAHNHEAESSSSDWNKGFYFSGKLTDSKKRNGIGTTYSGTNLNDPTEGGEYKDNRLVKGKRYVGDNCYIYITEETDVSYQNGMVERIENGPATIFVNEKNSEKNPRENYDVVFRNGEIQELKSSSHTGQTLPLTVGQRYEYLPKKGVLSRLKTEKARVSNMYISSRGDNLLYVDIITPENETITVPYNKIDKYLRTLPEPKPKKKS